MGAVIGGIVGAIGRTARVGGRVARRVRFRKHRRPLSTRSKPKSKSARKKLNDRAEAGTLSDSDKMEILFE